MSVMTKEEKKQLFLAVKDAWPEITANFSEKGVTRQTRVAAWQKVFDECRANGHAWTNGRDAKWLSGNKWPGIVKEVKDRADKNRRTGSSGDTKLSELDEMVLDIIGRDSAGVRGLQVPDSDEGRVAEENFAEARNVSGTESSPSGSSQALLNFVPKPHTPSTPLPPLGAMPGGLYKLPRSKRPLQSVNSQSADDDPAEEEFKRKKMQWLDGMLQLNEQKRYINQLTIQKLEKELAQPPAEEAKENGSFGSYGYAYTMTNL